MPPDSRFTQTPDAWDIVLATDNDDDDPLTLMLAQDDSVAMWEGIDAPSLSTDSAVYREMAVMWQPQLGCGHSRRLEETSTTGPDGQIVSLGTSYGRNATFVVPGIVMPAGKLTPVELPAEIAALSGRIFDVAEYGSSRDLYMTTGTKYLLKIAGGDGSVTTRDFGTGYTTRALQIFDGKMYLSGEASGPIQELDGATWTAAAAQCEASRLERVNWAPSDQIMGGSGGGTSADHLILTDFSGFGFYHVVSGNDPKVFANWISVAGAPIPVGDPNYLIQNIVASPRTVWFAKPNGLHGFTETGRAVNLTPWMERTYHPSNGGAVAFYSDDERAMAFIAHEQGLVAVTVNGTQQETARFIQFGGRTANETPIWGRPRWMTPHVDGLFVAYFDGSTSYVMRLILEKDGSYRWSGSECTIEGEEITFMRVTSPDGNPRLWIATIITSSAVGTVGELRLYWQSLPVTGNPWVDYQAGTAHRYAEDWDVYLPRDDAGSSAHKVIRRYDLVARNITGGNSITVDASADDGVYDEQGIVSTGPRGSFIASEYTRATWINWRLRCQNSVTTPLAVETFQARMSVLPEQVDAWTFRCQLAAGQGLGNDAESGQDPYLVRARIRAYQRRGPIKMRRSPLSRETLTVKVEQGARIQAVWSRKDRAYIVVLTFTVSVLSFGAIYGVDAYDAADYGEE